MKRFLSAALFVLFSLTTAFVFAETTATKRLPQFSNQNVRVWKTIIYPSKNQALPMHRHDHARVVVALTDGTLKVTNAKGKSHYIKLVKDKAYYFDKDKPNEMHTDLSMSDHPIKVMVIEFNY